MGQRALCYTVSVESRKHSDVIVTRVSDYADNIGVRLEQEHGKKLQLALRDDAEVISVDTQFCYDDNNYHTLVTVIIQQIYE